jgi:hypothetical protein
MCGAAKDQEATVVDEPCGCCSSKVERCATGVLDNSTLADNDSNDCNQDTKDPPVQVATQSTCCDSRRNKAIKACEETDKGWQSSVSKDDCKDGCCDDENSANEDDGCEDGCCSVDDTCEKDKESQTGCCSSTNKQETFGDDTTCKRACCGSIVVKPIEAGCGNEEETNSTIITHFGSSSGCCSTQNKVDTVCASTKNNSQSCTIPADLAATAAPTPRSDCCSTVPRLSTEKTSVCSDSKKDQASGSCPTILQVIKPPKKGCCGPEAITAVSPLPRQGTSGTCSATQLSKNGDGCCDAESPDDAGCSSPTKDQDVRGTKSCCTGDSPIQSENGCCSEIPRKGKTGQVSKSKSSKSKSRAASLGASDLQLLISGKS